MKKPRIIAYISHWHQSQSPAFRKILSEPLQGLIEVEFRPVYTYEPAQQTCPIVFCQHLPAQKLPERAPYPITWLPMADNYHIFPREFWADLPNYLKIIALSNPIDDAAKQSNLAISSLRFYLNPDDFAPRDWTQPRTLMYWNRLAIIRQDALLALSQSLAIKRLLFRPKLDPEMPSTNNYLPSSNRMDIKLLTNIDTQADYLRWLTQAHVYLAPRHLEGVGLSFLEAMASGCVVIALDSPTMNEYIQHNRNGILLPYNAEITARINQQKLRIQQAQKKRLIGRFLKSFLMQIPHPHHISTDDLDIHFLNTVNLEKLGNTAREQHYVGYQQWISQVSALADFILT